MKKSFYTLVINLGLKSTRAIVFDSKGREIVKSGIDLESFVNDIEVEQDANEWWRKTKKVLKDVLINKTIRKNIEHITVTCSSSCLIAVDKNGQPVRKVIMVSDKRAVQETQQIKDSVEFLSLSRRKDIRVDPSFMLPKILWIKNHESEIFIKTYKFLSPNDFLFFKLTNTFVTDTLNAEKLYYDIEKRSYPKDLYLSLGIAIEKLPNVVIPGTIIGKLDKKIVSELNINPAADAIVTTYDAIGAVFGSGVTGENDACDISGTITSIRTVVKNSKIKNKNKNIFIQPLDYGKTSIIGATSNQGGSIIEWLRQALYENHKEPYVQIGKDAARSTIGAFGLFFLPYLLGERSPLWNPNATASLFGLQRFHKRPDITRAVLESTGFLAKAILDEIESVGLTITNVKAAGGLASLPFVLQLKADILGKKIYIVKYSEASAFGVFLMVLVARRQYPNIKSAVKDLVLFKKVLRPNMKNHEKYSKIYMFYKDLYQTLKQTFDKRKELVEVLYKEEKLQEIQNL